MRKETIDNTEIMFNYKINDENSKKLIVVFQSNGASINSCLLLKKKKENKITDEEYKIDLEKAHSRLVYYKTFDKYNVLFITDYFLELGSWYMFDENGKIMDKVAKFIETFCYKNNYDKENVILMGTSKGGFGALLYSTQYDLCNNVIVAFPIVSPFYRFVNAPQKSIIAFHYNSINLNNLNLSELDEVLLNPKFNPRIVAVLGISDEQTSGFLERYKMYSKCNIYICDYLATHSQYSANVKFPELYSNLAEAIFKNEKLLKLNIVGKEYYD